MEASHVNAASSHGNVDTLSSKWLNGIVEALGEGRVIAQKACFHIGLASIQATWLRKVHQGPQILQGIPWSSHFY